MSLRRKSSVPATPQVIAPSPTASEVEADEYIAPTTRSAVKKRMSSMGKHEEIDEDEHISASRQSRARSRSPIDQHKVTRMTTRSTTSAAKEAETPEKSTETADGKATITNGHLAPPQPAGSSGWSWRSFSRSPSPLGLIPIHRHWRSFVHKYEVPRKVLHVSIGFFVVWLYTTGSQTTWIPPYLMALLIPIASTDWLRHRYASLNRVYVRYFGALMRESEYAGWNGVIFYLLGAWSVLFFFPKDVAVMSILLLSWCDTAASTFGRLWGRYTPRLRRGKSLAGSLAACIVGVATAFFFWGWLVPILGYQPGNETFMFKGTLSLPNTITEMLGISQEAAMVSGSLALGFLSTWSGFVASASEVVDLFGWDDNLTIPVLSGIGIWGFLKLFG